MSGPQAVLLPDGKRLHLQHGPIDLIIQAFGDEAEASTSYRQAAARFETILQELVDELPLLRRPCDPDHTPDGIVARRMHRAASRHLPGFVTPMVAVAGSVADEVLAALVRGRQLERAYVNNGGDVAVFLSQGASIDMAIATADAGFPNRVKLHADDPSRGAATSGWRGRSQSMGIADAVTVLAEDAATADAAATVIANAVDVPGSTRIERRPAIELDPDSDLGERPVTAAVGDLTDGEIRQALDAGLKHAVGLQQSGMIHAAALFLAGESRTTAS